MKVLLDECLPVDFRRSFQNHDVHTVEWAGLKGKSNGELLRAAELAGYDVLLTVDQGLPISNLLPASSQSFCCVPERISSKISCHWWARSF